MRLISMTTAAMGVLAGAGPANAAEITWGTPYELISDADIDLTHPLVYALNAGDTTNNPTIANAPLPTSPLTVTIAGQPVVFDHVEAIYGELASFGQLGFPFETFGDATDHLAGGSENVTFSTTDTRTVAIPQVSVDKGPTVEAPRTYDVTTGNTELDILLNSQVFFDGRNIGSSALNISLNNLTPGKAYQVQVIAAADSRVGGNTPSTVTLDDGLGNSVGGLSGYADVDNDTVQHVTTVIGTFTADAGSQAINAVLEDKRNGGISGLILTEIAETFVPGDTDGDGDVDDSDLGTAFSNYTGPLGDGVGTKTAADGDTDGDGDVDDSDLGTAFSGYTGPIATANVPEPTSLALVGLGGLALVRRRRD